MPISLYLRNHFSNFEVRQIELAEQRRKRNRKVVSVVDNPILDEKNQLDNQLE